MAEDDFDTLLAKRQSAGPATQVNTNDPLILWTRSPRTAPPAGRTPDGAPDYHTYMEQSVRAASGANDRQITVSEAVGNFWSWSSEQRAAFGKRLYAAGIIDDPSNFVAMQAAWERAVEGAAASGAAGAPRTPWEIIDLWDGLSDNPREPKKTVVQRQNDIPTAQEADAMVRQIFRDQVGRDPDEGELSKYRGMVIRKVADNPTVTTTTYDADGNPNSVSRGGLDVTAAIQDMVQDDDDYGTYQAATTYFNALLGALGSPL